MLLKRNSLTNDPISTKPKDRLARTFQTVLSGLLLLLALVANTTADGGMAPHDTTKANPPQIDNYHGHPASTGQKLNYDSLYSIATPLSASPKVQTLIDNVMLRYGGRSELEKLTSFGLGYVSEGHEDSSVSVIKVWSAGRHLKNSRTTDQTSSRFLNGQECWLTVKGQVQAASPQRYCAELYSYLVLAMPLAIEKETFAEIRYGRRDDDSLEYLYLLKPDSLMIVLGIDSEDHLINSCEGIVYEKESRTSFKNLFSDFREVEGYVFPHRIQNFSMGMDMGALILVNVEIRPILPEGLFRPKKLP